MQVIFRISKGRFYPSYVLTILFFFKVEIFSKELVTHRKLSMDTTMNTTILNNLVGFTSAFYNVTDSYVSRVFYYLYILIFLNRFENPIGEKAYIFDRNDFEDYHKGNLTKEQLLIVSKVDEYGN
jgi:hypothetical protein